MKKYLLTLFIYALMWPGALLAQQAAIISGTASQNGFPLPGLPINLEAIGNPNYSITTYTDSLGFYEDTVLLNNAQLIIVTSPCSFDTLAVNPNQLAYTVDIDCSTGLGSCVADFFFRPEPNNSVFFTPVVAGNVSYNWDFGDGNNSTSPNPTHYYNSPGQYTVCLTVVDSSAGCSDSACLVVNVGNVGNNCNANFSYTNLQANTYEFVGDSSLGPDAVFIWEIGAGTVLTGRSITVNLPNGFNQVCLNVQDTTGGVFCTDRSCEFIQVGSSGNCAAGYAFYNLQGDTYQFLDSSFVGPNAIYNWDFGNGMTSNQQNPVATLPAGIYQVCLTVIDSVGSGVCTDTYCSTLTLGNNNTCTADFNIFPTPAGGFAFSAFHQSNTAIYTWDLGDGTTASGPTANNSYRTGTYTICLTIDDTANNCFDSFCQVINVGQQPLCSAFFFPLDLGNNEFLFFSDSAQASSFIWDFGTGDSALGPNPQYTFPTPGLYTVCLYVSDSSGCSDTFCEQIQVGRNNGNNNCIADFDFLPLPNGDVQFLNLSYDGTASGQNFSSFWDFGDGTTSNALNPVHTYQTPPDSFWVCLNINSANCADTICKIVFPLPDSTNFPGCDAAFSAHNTGAGVVAFNSLCPSPNLTYTWSFGDGNTDNSAAPVHTYANPGVYYVCLTVMDSLINCNATFCDSVYVGNNTGGPGQCAVISDFTYQDLGNGTFDFIELTSAFGIPGTGAGLSFFWDFGDSTSSTQPNPQHTFLGPGPYLVCLTVSDSSGQCVATTCHVIGTTNPNSGFHVSGAVFADSQLINNGVVYLIRHDTTANGGSLTAVDSTYLSQSFFTFFNVQPGTYLVKSALLPASPFYQNYMPTYLGDVMQWNNASSVVVTNQNLFVPPISLIPGNNPGGPGFIGGLISQGANKNLDGMPGVSILLMTAQEDAVIHAVSGSGGNYEFKNLALGTYHVYVEIAGKLSEKWVVDLTSQNARFEDADFQVLEAEVLAVGATSIPEFSFGELLNVYPNPTKGNLNLELKMESQKDIKISVTTLVGQKLIEREIEQVIGERRIELDLDGLLEGTYLLRIEADGESMNRLIIKR
ncbi:MAG: PKD domain-containing protein [Bacteroidota bacterium]